MMSEQRPNPDELLARVQAEAARETQGKLKIFFGAAAGVGKTYAMLEDAHDRKAAGVDVVVGWVDTHGRVETELMLRDLETLPRQNLTYRGTTIPEFDLDRALARRPALILVDELAHTNATGARHAKRWQDVSELLQAGIDVYTTVNVQHLESLNDVVAQITGVVVRETVPDAIFERADEVELIDLPPDELLQRLRAGKVYIPHQAERALRSFFRKGNLIALRELALRRTADRVDAQMQAYRHDHAIGPTWPAAERILVCVSPSPLAPHLVRAARRMAAGLRAEWVVVYVEIPGQQLRAADRTRVVETLRLAELLGAETATLSGTNIGDEILTYARRRNVTKIVVGKPTHPRWRDVVFGSRLDDMVRRSGDIDVYVISGAQSDEGTQIPSFEPHLPSRTSKWPAYVGALGIVAGATLLAWLMYPYFAEANLIMVYVLGVVLAATRLGRGPAILVSILSVGAFDFFFVPPFFAFAVAQAQYLVTFAVMLVVTLVISTLTVRLRLQAQHARDREQRTAALYQLSRDLASTRSIPELLHAAAQQMNAVFGTQVAILLANAGRNEKSASSDALAVVAAAPKAPRLDSSEQGVARWVYEHGEMAGFGTNTLPGAEALYLPLRGTQSTVGVLGVWPSDRLALWEPEQLHLLETFANQTAVAVERATLAAEAEQARVQIEAERLRSTLLSSVSHDLRTPLASITGAASSLLDDDATIPPAMRQDLLETIVEESERLNRLVANLLEMTRLESGNVEVVKEWQPLEEVIGAALDRLDRQLAQHTVRTHLSADLRLVPLDGVLIEQVLINLLENAAKYTPAATTIDIGAAVTDQIAIVTVADDGPGLLPGDEERVFDKFYRSGHRGHPTGAGLGLAICRAIVEAHGGRIWAERRPAGGTIFSFTLPLDGAPPTLQQAEPDDSLPLFVPQGE